MVDLGRFPGELLVGIVISVTFGMGAAGCAFAVHPDVQLLRAAWLRFVPAGHWIWYAWEVDGRQLALVPAFIAGVAFFIAGTAGYNAWLGAAAGLITFTCTYMATLMAWVIASAVRDFAVYLSPYIGAIAKRGTGFVAAYVMTLIGFGILFESLYEHEATSFSGVPNVHITLGEFVFYSLTTMTSVGLSDIHPQSPWAKLASSAEVLLGLFLLVGVFGVFLAQSGPMLTSVRQTRVAKRSSAGLPRSRRRHQRVRTRKVATPQAASPHFTM
jgi:hypothetical protein